MLTYLMLGIGDAGSHSEIVKVGGWFGLASAATGLYGALCLGDHSTIERTLLPLVPLRRKAQRLAGPESSAVHAKVALQGAGRRSPTGRERRDGKRTPGAPERWSC